MVEESISVNQAHFDLRTELHFRLLLSSHYRTHMRLMDAHHPLRNTKGLVPALVGLLLVKLSDRLHIGLVFFLQRILCKRGDQIVIRLQIPLHIAQLPFKGCFMLHEGLVLLLVNAQVDLPDFLPANPGLQRPVNNRSEQLVDDLLAFLTAGVQKTEIRRIVYLLCTSRCINLHATKVHGVSSLGRFIVMIILYILQLPFVIVIIRIVIGLVRVCCPITCRSLIDHVIDHVQKIHAHTPA